ncbi:winged helix-turn-helix domain-containing protein [Nonomuraea sp. NPDC049269]|uniref:winged helix-turn-helix domain-containing protein n=1 Tax=Nonomuraea sp. NPDC049269 TaxID=3364349 RepID=UPI00371AC874
MIKWQPQHRWEEVTDDLRRRILAGEYPPRTAIPAVPRLMQMYDIGRNTALHVISALAEQGLVVVRRSKGTFVVPTEDWPELDG